MTVNKLAEIAIVCVIACVVVLTISAVYQSRRADHAETRADALGRMVDIGNSQSSQLFSVLTEHKKLLKSRTDERDAALRMVDRLRAQKPTLEAVRRAWAIEGRLECAVVPLGSARAVSETFLAR